MNNGFLNGVSALVAGGYVGAVIYRGNFDKLMEAAKDDIGFVKWLIAFGVLYGLSKNKTTAPVAAPLTVATLIGLGIQTFGQNENIAEQISDLWKGLD